MREKKIFVYLVLTWFILLAVYIYIEKTGVEIFQTDKRNQMITLKEAQDKIDTLLLNKPIIFTNNSSSISTIENNQSLNRVVELLKRVDSNMFVNISSHTSTDGESSKNRILSQRRADTILSFIKKRYHTDAIEAIGYGEEFPLTKEDNGTIASREVEITLYPLPPKI